MNKPATKFQLFVSFFFLFFALILGIGLSTVKAQDMDVEHSSEFGFIDAAVNSYMTPPPLSPVSGNKIVDQGALSQYTSNNYLHFDAFDFHGNYQGNNAQELTPIPDPAGIVSLPGNFPVLGNVFTLEVQVYSAAQDNLGHRTIIGNDANPSGREKDRPPTITFNKVNGVNQVRYGFGVGPDQKGKRRIIESVVTDNQWYHIAFTFDGTTTKLYVNGVEVECSDFASGLTPHPVPISLIGRKFLGKIDEVRIWNIARTQGDIQSSMAGSLVGNEPGLIAYYPMNVNQDWEVIDEGPNSYNATISNVEILQRYSSIDCPSTNGTLECPYLTINGAIDDSQGGDTIFIKDGRYSEVLFKELLNQSPETEGPKLTIKGESQNVILDGTVPLITTWQLIDGKYEASVDMNQLSNAAGAKVEDIYALWVDDRYMIPAMPVNFTNPTDVSTSTQNNPEIGTVFEKNLTAPYVYSHMVQDEYIVGDINNLDAIEEWSFDEANKKLYLIPGENIPDSSNVRVRVRTKIVNIEFSDHLEFRNLHFFAGAFKFFQASYILLEDSKFSHSWEAGMSYLIPGIDAGWERGNFIKGGTNNTVRNSIFQYINDAFAFSFSASMNPLAENVLFQYNDWFKNTVWAPGASDNFTGGNKWYDNTSVIGGSTFRNVTMDQNHTGGLQPGLGSLVEYARIQNQYINIDGGGIQRTQGNVINSTTRYSWLLDTNRNGMRLDSQCGGTDAVIHNVVSAGNKRGFRLKGDRHRAFHLLAYDTNTNDISMPRNKYCGDDWGNHDGVNSETMAGNLNSRLLNSIAEKSLSAHMPDAGDPNITQGNGQLIAENTSNEFLLNQSGIWFGRALDEDKIAPFVYPHFELQDPWVENRYRPNESLTSQFGLNPFINGVQGFDFRPRKGSPLLDGGVIIPGINDGQDIDPATSPNHPPSYTGQHRAFVGDAPDIGAYEYGDSVYWIPGYRYYYPTVPIPGDGAVDVPLEYGLAFNYPWSTDYSSTVAEVKINGPGMDKTVLLNYPNNVVFETFLPGQTYNWSVNVGDVTGETWSFTVADRIYPLNDRSVDVNASDVKLIPNHDKSLSLSDGVLSFMKFDIPSSINDDYRIFLNLTPESITSLQGSMTLYEYNYDGWSENLDPTNIGLLDHSLLTPLNTISTIQPSVTLSVDITDYIDTNGEVSLVLGLSNPNDQLSFYSKEKMITDGLDIYVMAGDLLGPSGNGSGYGPQIDVWPNISFVTVPGTPTGISATGGNAEADVSWTAPVSDGGSVISQYTVTSSPDGITATTSGTSVTVTGLTNGTSYTFAVTATNSVGTGSASGASSAVVPATVPGSPTAVSAVGGNAQATVSWTAPTFNGGSAITQYMVTSSPGNLTATTTGVSATVTGLTNGTQYRFEVTATNSEGNSLASNPSNAVTLATVPGAPTGISATGGNEEADVSWRAPVSDGGAAISQYTVISSPGGLTATTAGTSVTVTGLTNGTVYTFAVTATNSAGTGPVSMSSTSIHVPPQVFFNIPDSSATLESGLNTVLLGAVSGGFGSFTAQINWGDGTSRTVTVIANNVVGGTHTYDSTGSYTATITVTDSLGQQASDSILFNVTGANATVAIPFLGTTGLGIIATTILALYVWMIHRKNRTINEN